MLLMSEVQNGCPSECSLAEILFASLYSFADLCRQIKLIIIHAEHVVHRRGYCFDFGCMFVCLYVTALERKRLIGMT